MSCENINELEKEAYHVASVSFGKDSLAMLLLTLEYPEKVPPPKKQYSLIGVWSSRQFIVCEIR